MGPEHVCVSKDLFLTRQLASCRMPFAWVGGILRMPYNSMT